MILPAHSPLGASGAERWMNCPGSIHLLQLLGYLPEDDADYRVDGTTAHLGRAHCLEAGKDAWEIVGQEFDGVEFTDDMAIAVQVDLDLNRSLLDDDSMMVIEYQMHHPEVHKLFFGTIDTGIIQPKRQHLDVNDYKHGAGIYVEVKDNPQLLYYAYGMLLHPDAVDVKTVTMRIIQPRVFDPEKVREWTVSADYVRTWARDVLVPHMLNALTDKTLAPGEWCRFCPVKLACPMLKSLYHAAAERKMEDPEFLDDQALGMDFAAMKVVDMYAKAVRKEAFRRMMQGTKIPNTKLVNSKADRVWKEGARERMEAQFGAECFDPPSFKSPAQMEKIIGAKELVSEWAYKPQTGLTVVSDNDRRPSIQVKPASQTFAETARQLELIE